MATNMTMSDVACIVVHHNSPATLVHTLDALILTGVTREQILIVDNSAEQGRFLPSADDLTVLYTDNRGYAAAVNDGLDYLNLNGLAKPFTLISTHESLPAPDAVRLLLRELADDATIAVAGPTLLNADADMQVWSLGGRLTPALKLPRHHIDAAAHTQSPAVDREWLDGAFTLYRTIDLEQFKLDESYFLYFEETDLHTRLSRSGRRVVWVPSASVSQRSSGIPPRLLGRNLFLFHRKLFSRTSGRLAVSFELVRALARAALTRRGRWGAFPEIARGWREAEQIPVAAVPPRSVVAGGTAHG